MLYERGEPLSVCALHVALWPNDLAGACTRPRLLRLCHPAPDVHVVFANFDSSPAVGCEMPCQAESWKQVLHRISYMQYTGNHELSRQIFYLSLCARTRLNSVPHHPAKCEYRGLRAVVAVPLLLCSRLRMVWHSENALPHAVLSASRTPVFLLSTASTMRDSGSPFVLARRGPHVIFTLTSDAPASLFLCFLN